MNSEGMVAGWACHRAWTLFTAAALVGHSALGPLEAAEPRQVERRGVVLTRTVMAARLPYIAITPASFQTSKERWPLIVFLHGGDQSGSDLSQVKLNGPPKYALSDPDFPFVVVAPQLPVGKLWEPQAVLAVVKQAIRRYRIDPAQVYLAGLSTGGYGTWKTVLQYPEVFAAAVPVAGGCSTEIIKHAQAERLQALRSLPVWAFHGGADDTIAPDESERMVSELQSIGNPWARVTVYPGAPHDIWDRVFDNPALYQWLLQQRR